MAFGRIEIAASVVDTNPITKALTGDTGLIRYYSNAFCEMVVHSTHPIDENLYIIRNGNSTIYGSSGTFNGVESSIFTFSAEDAKGNVGKETLDIPTIPYVKLTCNLKNNKPDAFGNMDVVCTGSYFSGSFGAVDNTLEVEYRYKKQGDSFGDDDWQTMSVSTGGGIYSATASFVIPDFNYETVYTFECKAVDKLSTISHILNDALDGGRLGADNGHQTGCGDHVSEAYVDKFHTKALLTLCSVSARGSFRSRS